MLGVLFIFFACPDLAGKEALLLRREYCGKIEENVKSSKEHNVRLAGR